MAGPELPHGCVAQEDNAWAPTALERWGIAVPSSAAASLHLGCEVPVTRTVRTPIGPNWQCGAAEPAAYDPVAAYIPSCPQPGIEPLTDMTLEQVGSLLSSTDLASAISSTCDQLDADNITCPAHEPAVPAAADALGDCSIDATFWATVPDTTAATEAVGLGAVPEPLYDFAHASWTPVTDLATHVGRAKVLPSPTSAVMCGEHMQQGTAFSGAAAGPHPTACAASPVSGRGSGSTGNKSGNILMTQVSDTGSPVQLDSRTAARGRAAVRSPGIVRGSGISRREANKLAQRRQRHRKQEEVEQLKAQVATMKTNQSSLRTRLESVRSENLSLLSRLSDITGKWQQTVGLNASLQQENAQHKAELAELQQHLTAMQAQLQEGQPHYVPYSQQIAASWSDMLVASKTHEQFQKW